MSRLYDVLVEAASVRRRTCILHQRIKRMKRTIRTLGWRFNAERRVMDYTLKC